MEAYRRRVFDVVAQFGGHYRVLAGPFEVVEGNWQPTFPVLIDVSLPRDGAPLVRLARIRRAQGDAARRHPWRGRLLRTVSTGRCRRGCRARGGLNGGSLQPAGQHLDILGRAVRGDHTSRVSMTIDPGTRRTAPTPAGRSDW